MGILAPPTDERVAGVRFSDGAISVDLIDGRTISAPLIWYPRLLNATLSQRNDWRIASEGYGIHWPQIDEGLSTEALLRGTPAPDSVLPGFERVWQALMRKLNPGTVVPGWTAPGGYTGEVFTVSAVSDSRLDVDAPGGKHFESVSREDFERILAVWPDYIAGGISHVDLRELTRFSKYVIGILKWMEAKETR